MISSHAIISAMLLYAVALFMLARWGESGSALAQRWSRHPLTYALSLTIYCTAWTFYGLTGMAVNSGMHYIALYLAPSVALIFSWSFYRRLIHIKNRYHITSLVDFLVARYQKSHALGVLASLFIMVGILPYIAIQLKMMVTTYEWLTIRDNAPVAALPLFDLLLLLGLIIFSIIFGVRHIDPTERHPGMILALAFESLIKLTALLALGLVVCWGMYDGLSDILQQAQDYRLSIDGLQQLTAPLQADFWLALLVVSAGSFILLPRQFHVAVIENHDVNHLRTAQWLVPAYLLLITFFVVPMAAAGLLQGHKAELADLFVLLLALSAEMPWLLLLVYIGGFSAAMGMLSISVMTISTIVTNSLIMPAVEHFNICRFLRRHILHLRWLLVALLIIASYLFYRGLSDFQILAFTGLISFVASLQFAPAVIGGLYWENGSLKGAMAGLAGGIAVWFFTMIIPLLARNQWLGMETLQHGLFAIDFLRPEALFYTGSLHPLAHAVFWSLLINSSLYVVFSRLFPAAEKAFMDARCFVHILADDDNFLLDQKADILLTEKTEKAITLLADYYATEDARLRINTLLQQQNISAENTISIAQLTRFYHAVEGILAGSIGVASAHKVMLRSGLISEKEQQRLAETYADIIARLNISPEQLQEKVDYYQEREKLLALNAEELQQQVRQRTAELQQTNGHLSKTLNDLQNMQAQLVEADKMASLGRLVAGIAHEINTPLGVSVTAVSYLDDIQREMQKKLDAGAINKNEFSEFMQDNQEGVSIIMENTRRAAELVKSFKQVAVDHSTDDVRPFVLNNYLHEIILSLKPEFKQTQHRIRVECADDIEVNTFAGALSQILTNMLMNSLHHAFPPGSCGQIVIRAERHEHQIRLCYQDDGVGMSADTLQQVFEPFFTTRRGQGGSGLGTTIIYNLVVQKLKGKIQCDSSPGQGTRYTLNFPADVLQLNSAADPGYYQI